MKKLSKAQRFHNKASKLDGTKVMITKSQNTNNWLVTVEGVILDSALSIKDARKVRDWFVNAIAQKPLPPNWQRPEVMKEWRESFGPDNQPPFVNAEMFIIDNQTGEVTISTIFKEFEAKGAEIPVNGWTGDAEITSVQISPNAHLFLPSSNT